MAHWPLINAPFVILLDRFLHRHTTDTLGTAFHPHSHTIHWNPSNEPLWNRLCSTTPPYPHNRRSRDELHTPESVRKNDFIPALSNEQISQFHQRD